MTDPVTSMQVRDEFEALLVRDLLGPWDGSEEELRRTRRRAGTSR
ncbi:MAG: hypothetical protein WKF73_18205 [Nocardioidaceae bacterium]